MEGEICREQICLSEGKEKGTAAWCHKQCHFVY